MPDEQVERHLQQWEPLLARIVAATDGDPTAGEQVQQALDERAGSQDWAALAVVLRRVLAGDRDPSELLDGLDPIDAAITSRLLDALAGRVQLDPAPPAAGDQPPQELPEQWQQVIGAVVAAAHGDSTATQALHPQLNELDTDPDWRALVGALRAILTGQRDPDRLLIGLDTTGSTILRAILAALAVPEGPP